MMDNFEKISYVVIKIGDRVFSTTFFEKPKHVVDLRRSEEKGNMWIKGVFTETKNHVKLTTPVEFELNIYSMKECKKNHKQASLLAAV